MFIGPTADYILFSVYMFFSVSTCPSNCFDG